MACLRRTLAVLIALLALVLAGCDDGDDGGAGGGAAPGDATSVPAEDLLADVLVEPGAVAGLEEVAVGELDTSPYQVALRTEMVTLFETCATVLEPAAIDDPEARIVGPELKGETRLVQLAYVFGDPESAEDFSRVLTPPPVGECLSRRLAEQIETGLAELDDQFRDRGFNAPAPVTEFELDVARAEQLVPDALGEVADAFSFDVTITSEVLPRPETVEVDWVVLQQGRVATALLFSERAPDVQQAVIRAVAESLPPAS